MVLLDFWVFLGGNFSNRDYSLCNLLIKLLHYHSLQFHLFDSFTNNLTNSNLIKVANFYLRKNIIITLIFYSTTSDSTQFIFACLTLTWERIKPFI